MKNDTNFCVTVFHSRNHLPKKRIFVKIAEQEEQFLNLKCIFQCDQIRNY